MLCKPPKWHVSDIKLLEKCCGRNTLGVHLSGLGLWNNVISCRKFELFYSIEIFHFGN